MSVPRVQLTPQRTFNIPSSLDPAHAFFIVLPSLPNEPVSYEHHELLQMVHDRQMGWALSYRWLEECLNKDELLPPAGWQIGWD
jgi:hypothetical protein